MVGPRESETESTMHLEAVDTNVSSFEMSELGGDQGAGGGDGSASPGVVDNGENDPETRIDFVLAFKNPSDGSKSDAKAAKLRETYEHQLEKRHRLNLRHVPGADGKVTYVLLQAPFDRLCLEAEHIKLKMPLRSMTVEVSSRWAS